MSTNPFLEQDEFSDQKFESFDARGVSIEGRTFYSCTFVGGLFGEAILKRCRFSDCHFVNCDLSNASVTSSVIRDSRFEDCKLLGLKFSDLEDLMHVSFDKCVLNYANFSGTDLRKCAMKDCVAKETDFSEANLTDANCQGSDFSGARFANTNLTKADFRKAINYAIRPDNNKIKKAKFSLPEATSLLYGLDIELED